jgi:hypothetical protein
MIPAETIQKAIYLVRSQKVMLDRDLAAMYGLPTRALKQAVRRNVIRLPADCMFVFTREELADWRSQSVTSNSDRMGLRHAPMAFTEQGVAMLSNVLNWDPSTRPRRERNPDDNQKPGTRNQKPVTSNQRPETMNPEA